jgi:hypothetical protein
LNIGYVVIDTGRAAPELQAFAKQVFRLTYIARDGAIELYRTPLGD